MPSHSSRQRIVYAAAQSLRQRGIAGTGLRGLVADAGAPWGSLHHYFPDGKDQVVAEAINWAGDFAGARVRHYLDQADTPTPYGMFADLIDTWIDDLARNGYLLGCPVVGAVADGPEPGDKVHRACEQALEQWHAPLREGLTTMGTPHPEAIDLATTMLACAEGAILMARITASPEPLEAVKRTLRPLLSPAHR